MYEKHFQVQKVFKFVEICDMTDHDWHCLLEDVQEINRWKKDVCFLHLDLIPSIQRNYAKLIGLVSTKACWKHKQHDNCRHSAWHSYIVSSFIKLLQWRCNRWTAHSVQATHQNHTMEDLRQATWVASVNRAMHCSCTSLYMLNLFHIKLRRC